MVEDYGLGGNRSPKEIAEQNKFIKRLEEIDVLGDKDEPEQRIKTK